MTQKQTEAIKTIAIYDGWRDDHTATDKTTAQLRKIYEQRKLHQ